MSKLPRQKFRAGRSLCKTKGNTSRGRSPETASDRCRAPGRMGGVRARGTFVRPIFIIERTLGFGKPVLFEISAFVSGEFWIAVSSRAVAVMACDAAVIPSERLFAASEDLRCRRFSIPSGICYTLRRHAREIASGFPAAGRCPSSSRILLPTEVHDGNTPEIQGLKARYRPRR